MRQGAEEWTYGGFFAPTSVETLPSKDKQQTCVFSLLSAKREAHVLSISHFAGCIPQQRSILASTLTPHAYNTSLTCRFHGTPTRQECDVFVLARPTLIGDKVTLNCCSRPPPFRPPHEWINQPMDHPGCIRSAVAAEVLVPPVPRRGAASARSRPRVARCATCRWWGCTWNVPGVIMGGMHTI